MDTYTNDCIADMVSDLLQMWAEALKPENDEDLEKIFEKK